MQNTAFEKNQLQVRASLLVFDVVNQTVQDQRLAELWQTCDPSGKALAALKAVIQHLR